MARLGENARRGLGPVRGAMLDLGGVAVGGLLAAAAFVRGGKAVHPTGVVYRARLTIDGGPNAPQGSELLSTPGSDGR